MYPDVLAARVLRDELVSGAREITLAVVYELRCPVCDRRVWDHNSAFQRGGSFVHVPCYRRGEWDRFGLHVEPTPVRFSNPGMDVQ